MKINRLKTIIECLKYATTGDLPPNSKGGAFIHDPKVRVSSVTQYSSLNVVSSYAAKKKFWPR
jgi:hypothetical protein